MPFIESLSAIATHPVTMVSVGGAIGSNLRYWLGIWIDSHRWAGAFPLGTFFINVSGSFLLGFLAVIFLEKVVPAKREMYIFLGSGFCGGYTTFSTFEWETYKLIRDERWMTAMLNVVGSCAAGLIGVFLGAILAHLILGPKIVVGGD